MSNPDHISESLETIFWVKILKFFDADPDLQHCQKDWHIATNNKHKNKDCQLALTPPHVQAFHLCLTNLKSLLKMTALPNFEIFILTIANS
jgi:hypothetical protein